MKRLIFIVEKPTGEKSEVAWTAYPTVNRATKMGKALLSLGIAEKQQFRWSELVGRKCEVYMKPNTYVNKKGETVTATTIQDVNKTR